MSDINTNAVKTGTTNATKKRITAQNLKVDDVVRLLRDIDSAIFHGDENSLLIFNLPVCDVMVKYLELHYYFPNDFEKIEDFGEFFDNYFAGKFKEYIAAMNKCETSQLIDEAVQIRKQIAIGRLQNPITETLSKVNEILDSFAEDVKDIDPDTIRKFINDFSSFAKDTNPESITDTMLEKVISGNKAAQSKSE